MGRGDLYTSGVRTVIFVAMFLILTFLVLVPFRNVYASTPIVFDSSIPAACLVCSRLKWSHTIGSGSNRILLVGVSIAITFPPVSAVSAMTYGIESLSRLGDRENPASDLRVELWALPNPPTGTATVTVTLGAVMPVLAGGSVSYFNAVGTEAFTSADGIMPSPSMPKVAVNSNPGDLVVDTIGGTTVFTPVIAGSGQNERWNSGPLEGGFIAAGSDKPASSPVTMTWATASPGFALWALVAIALTSAATPTATSTVALPVPDYHLGLVLPLMAIFMVITYSLIKHTTPKSKKNELKSVAVSFD